MVKYPMPSNAPTVDNAPASSGTHVAAQSEHAYEGTVRAALLKLGANDPDADTAATNDFWRHCMALGIAPEVTASVIYSTARHRHAGTSTLKEASEAPTREEWEVIARRQGPMEKLLNAAGRKATAVEGNLVIFGDFYDDEAARSFAQTLTKAGYIVTYGPHKVPEAAEAEGDPSAMEVAPVISEAEKIDGDKLDVSFRHLLAPRGAVQTIGPERGNKKKDGVSRYVSEEGSYRYVEYVSGRPVAVLQVVSLDGRNAWVANVYVLPEFRRQGRAATLLARARQDFKQVEHAPEEDRTMQGEAWSKAVGEPRVVSEGRIPWVKVERNPKVHEAAMELAKKHGPIGSPAKVYEVVGADFEKEDQEVFLVLPLNLRGELKSPPIEIARGQRSHVAVGVNDVLRAVLDSGCEGYYVCHSHPTGKCTPSKADRDLTDQIKRATLPFGREVKYLDHFVVGRRQIYSIEEGKAYPIK